MAWLESSVLFTHSFYLSKRVSDETESSGYRSQSQHLRNYVVDYVPVEVGKAEVATGIAVSEFFVVEAK